MNPYRPLRYLTAARAVSRGPKATARWYVRRSAMRSLMRLLRMIGL